jgi:hypothetical protein
VGRRCHGLSYDNISPFVLTNRFIKSQFLIHEEMFHTITGDGVLKNACETYHLLRLGNTNNLVYVIY